MTNVPVARVEEDGQFSTVGLPPGRHSIMPMTGFGPPQTGGWDPVWKQESVRIGGRVIGRIEVQDADVTGVLITFFGFRSYGAVRHGARQRRPRAARCDDLRLPRQSSGLGRRCARSQAWP